MIFSAHARQRMRERGISQEEVEEALRNAYAVTPTDIPESVHLLGRTGVGRRLRISRMRFTDDEADAVYVYVLEDGTVASSEVLDDGRVIDLDEGGHLIGVEILEASERGARLADLIERFQLESLRAKLRNLEDRFRRVEPA